jgi:hypothetical protein
MKMHTAEINSFEFCFPNLDTLVQVEETDGGVVIRASRDTFSEARKEHFVRELAAEGFIANAHRLLLTTGPGAPHGVRWLVDLSCFRPGPEFVAGTRRFMVRVLLSAALLWLHHAR